MFYVYILTNQKHGALYTGITNNVPKRLHMQRSWKIELIERDNPDWRDLSSEFT